jgi:hypothetical protein
VTSEKADPSAKGAAPKPCTQALSRSPEKIIHFSRRFRSTPLVARLGEVAVFFDPAV